MVDRLVKHFKKLIDRSFHSSDDLIALGVDMPGVISDGQVYICSNLPFLAGVNIGALFEQRFTCPVVIINDGESGGLMEWRVRKKELLYWVIGGGWGGAWINAEGGVTCKGDFCEARDRALFLVNEPGYATGISEKMLGEIFEEYGLSPALVLRVYPCLHGPVRDRKADIRSVAYGAGISCPRSLCRVNHIH